MILVTGGAGFIGSHTCVELLNAGYEVVVIDNLCNSKVESLDAVKQITGKSCTFYKVDINDEQGLREVFSKHTFECVIHFAGLKAVGESVEKPHWYYSNNIQQCCQTFKRELLYFLSRQKFKINKKSLKFTHMCLQFHGTESILSENRRYIYIKYRKSGQNRAESSKRNIRLHQGTRRRYHRRSGCKIRSVVRNDPAP